ncbi:signal peptidase II [Patescibacteria group bacterium]
MVLFLILAIFFVSLDRFLKLIALKTTTDYQIIGDLFKFSFAHNYNIAFSLPLSGAILEILISIIIIILIVYSLILAKRDDYKYLFSLTFIIFGAISNLLDRIKYGFVIDYLDLEYFTVFNIADMMIVGGALLIFIVHFINSKHQGEMQ